MRFSLSISGVTADLFQDETISLTRQIKDFTALNTVFTDFTQSFQIPATDINNGIFYNYFEENIALNASGWSPAFKLLANIEIDSLPVFFGIIELLSVDYTDGVPRTYNICFYGQSKNLLTIWGEDMMNDIDWSAYNHNIDDATAVSSWTGGLLAGNVVWDIKDYGFGWTYTTAKISNNIAQGVGITFENLRPSILLKRVIEKIFTAYGFTLYGTLLARPEFTNLFVTPMNNAGPFYDVIAPMYGLFSANSTLTSVTASTTSMSGLNTLTAGNNIISNPSLAWSNVNNKYTVPVAGDYTFTYGVTLTNLTIGVKLFTQIVVNNKTVGNFVNGNSTSYNGKTHTNAIVRLSKGDIIELVYKSNTTMTVNTTIACTIAPPNVYRSVIMADAFPNVKIVDFLSSVLTSFNAIIIPDGSNGFEIHNLNDWYALGANKEYTKYIDFATMNQKKQTIPNSITMSHAKGEAFAQKFFYKTYKREYGSMSATPNVDFSEGELKIETLFSINPPQRLNIVNATGIVIAETDIDIISVTEDGNKAVRQDFILFYFQGTKAITYPFYFASVLKTSQPVSAPYTITPTTSSSYSLGFGLESPIQGDLPINTFYTSFWNTFISRLFSSKSRIVTLKGYIPVLVWLQMKLNDTISISGNYYKIQKVTYDLLSEAAVLELITYPNVGKINVTGSTRKTATYDIPASSTNGLTFMNGAGVVKGMLNATPFAGTYVTDAYPVSNYNMSETQKLLSIEDNLTNNMGLNQIVLYNLAVGVVNITTSLVTFNLSSQSNLGETTIYTGNGATSSVTINQSGQYRIRAVLSFHFTGSFQGISKIVIDDIDTEAYSIISGNHDHTVNLITSTIVGAGSIIKLAMTSGDGSSHNVTFSRISFTIEKII
jgi:hypothetical protein